MAQSRKNLISLTKSTFGVESLQDIGDFGRARCCTSLCLKLVPWAARFEAKFAPGSTHAQQNLLDVSVIYFSIPTYTGAYIFNLNSTSFCHIDDVNCLENFHAKYLKLVANSVLINDVDNTCMFVGNSISAKPVLANSFFKVMYAH